MACARASLEPGSAPATGFIPGYDDGGDPPEPKPVIIFGAGYDTGKDAPIGNPYVVPTDGVGRGIFIVDAQTGAKIWSVTPGANAGTNSGANPRAES